MESSKRLDLLLSRKTGVSPVLSSQWLLDITLWKNMYPLKFIYFFFLVVWTVAWQQDDPEFRSSLGPFWVEFTCFFSACERVREEISQRTLKTPQIWVFGWRYILERLKGCCVNDCWSCVSLCNSAVECWKRRGAWSICFYLKPNDNNCFHCCWIFMCSLQFQQCDI